MIQHAPWIHDHVCLQMQQELCQPHGFCSLGKPLTWALNICLTVLAMLHLHRVQWHSPSLLAEPYKQIPLLWSLLHGDVGWETGKHLGTVAPAGSEGWAIYRDFGTNKAPWGIIFYRHGLSSRLLSTLQHRVWAILPYTCMSETWGLQQGGLVGLLTLASADLLQWPRKASAQLSSFYFFTPLCNTTDFKNVPSAQQCLGPSPMPWKPTLPDFRLLKIRLRQYPWIVTGKRISGLLLTQPMRFRGSALICRVLAWFPRRQGLYDPTVCQSAAPQSTRVSWPTLARFGSGLTDTEYLEILWNEVDRDRAAFVKAPV